MYFFSERSLLKKAACSKSFIIGFAYENSATEIFHYSDKFDFSNSIIKP
jgi:hypothetical protein